MVVLWFKMQYPKLTGCLFAIPNGAHLAGTPKSRAIKMRKMKAEGFKNGVSDLFLAVPVGEYSGLWLEMKDYNKKASSLSVEQKEHLELMANNGYAAEWAAGFDEAKEIITDYMNNV